MPHLHGAPFSHKQGSDYKVLSLLSLHLVWRKCHYQNL